MSISPAAQAAYAALSKTVLVEAEALAIIQAAIDRAVAPFIAENEGLRKEINALNDAATQAQLRFNAALEAANDRANG